MRTAAVAGVGLIGGSFALSLRRAGFEGEILGVDRPEILDRAVSLGIVDRGVPLKEAASTADLLYLAQPIHSIIDCVGEIGPWVQPDTLVTDAGSTKRAIVQAASEHLKSCHFLGGHPLAGKESRGPESAEAGLFQGRGYVLTPVVDSDLTTLAAREFQVWLGRIGCRVTIMDAETHDRTVAYTSHLPQLLSTALADLLSGKSESAGAGGPALLDSTRLALSSFEVWQDILDTNADEIRQSLSDYIRILERLANDLRSSSDLRERFLRAAGFAKGLRETH